MEQCTWKDCLEGGLHRQVAEDGQVWAVLCDKHNSELNQAIDLMVKGDGPKAMLSAWVKAQGGAKKAAKRMVGEGER
jgi:hypothetical protein